MGSKGEGRKKGNKSVGWILYCIMLYTIFITAYAFLLWGTVGAYRDSIGAQRAYKSGDKVKAIINDIESTSDPNVTGHFIYYATYEYVDGDIVYSGRATAATRDYYKVEKYLGRTIEIYIDGQGGSIPVGNKPSFILPIICTVLDIVLFVPAFFWVRLGDWIAKIKEKRGQREKKVKEDNDLFFKWRKYD